MNEFEVVGIIDLLAVNGSALFSGCVNDLCICYKLLLVLPKEDQREWDHHAADDETSYAPLVFAAFRRRSS